MDRVNKMKVVFGRTGKIIITHPIEFTDHELSNRVAFHQKFLTELMPQLALAANKCFDDMSATGDFGEQVDAEIAQTETVLHNHLGGTGNGDCPACALEPEPTPEEMIEAVEQITKRVTGVLFGVARAAAAAVNEASPLLKKPIRK